MKDEEKNLCDSCEYHPATCESGEVQYGSGLGNDNIISCEGYKKVQEGSN